jgi:hypothetical protein
MKSRKQKSPLDIYKGIDALIGSTSSLAPAQRQALAVANFFALLSNVEVVKTA